MISRVDQLFLIGFACAQNRPRGIRQQGSASLFNFLVIQNREGLQCRDIVIGPLALPMGIDLKSRGLEGDKCFASGFGNFGDFDF